MLLQKGAKISLLLSNLLKRCAPQFHDRGLEMTSNEIDLYLHVGIGKTGTTSIQDFFYKNKMALDQMGILYPASGLRGSGHHNLAVFGPGGLSREVKNRFATLQREISKKKRNTVVLSSENFPWLKDDYVGYIKQAFSKYHTRVIIYVRNQVDLVKSTFLEWQKVGDDYRGNIASFFRLHAEGFNYLTRISPYLSAFGKDAIIARVFDKRIVGSDVRYDFLKVIGIAAEAGLDFSKAYSNISLLPEFSSIVSLLDEEKLSKPTRKKTIARLLDLSHQFKSLSTEQLIDHSLERQITDKYRNSNEKFAALFLDDHQTEIFLS